MDYKLAFIFEQMLYRCWRRMGDDVWNCTVSQKNCATIHSFITLTRPRCGGQRGTVFDANFLKNTTVKEVWKSANICQSYERMYSGTVFLTHCVYRPTHTRNVLKTARQLITYGYIKQTGSCARFSHYCFQNCISGSDLITKSTIIHI